MLESLFDKVAGLRVPTKVFSCEYCKSFKNSFFYGTPPLAAFNYSNQLKTFPEKTASKSNGVLRNFRVASFESNFWGLLLKRKERRRMTRSDPCSFRFSLFPGQLFIY